MSNLQARWELKIEQKNRNHNNKYPLPRKAKSIDAEGKYVFWDKAKAQRMLLWKLLDWGYYKNHWQIMDDILAYEKERSGQHSTFMFYIRSLFDSNNGNQKPAQESE
ncbi:hypothetical protein LCGC14_3087650 [marine sediment metagenome]|uniref:Uncharacterized protein n=1 Tax=marine sediment metagenome TaxID=412755 RepID=A0A0F8X036_9ZZZZ